MARKHQKVHRLNLELGPRSFQALEKLRTQLETASQAETIRIALQTLSYLVNATESGGRIVIQRTDDEPTEVLLTPGWGD